MMIDPFTTFQKNIGSIKTLDGLHKYLYNNLPAVDLSEILRAEVVLIISALDCYIHNVIRDGMLDIFKGDKPPNKNYNAFNIPIIYVEQLLLAETDQEKKEVMSTAIKKVASTHSYQSAGSIENALQLINIKKLWTIIKDDMELGADDIKKKLGIIIHRRNKIAHEADLDKITGEKIPITREDVGDIISFIVKFVEAINRQASL